MQSPPPVPEFTTASQEWVTGEIRPLREKIAVLSAQQRPPGLLESHVDVKIAAVSNQVEYFSNQVVKWDLEALSVTPTGLALGGAQIIKNPMQTWIENSSIRQRLIRSVSARVEGRDGRLASLVRNSIPDDVMQLTLDESRDGRLDTIDTRLDQHRRALSALADGQARSARANQSDVRPRAGVAESRGGRRNDAEARRLREVERSLTQVANAARAVSRELA